MDQDYKNFEGYLQRGAVVNAEAMARVLVQRFPQDERSYVAVARVLHVQGRLDEAIATLQGIRPLEARLPLAAAHLATMILSEGDYQKAMGIAQEALRIAPELPHALWAVGSAAYYLENYTQAADTLAQLTRVAPADMTAWKFLGMALRRSNRATAAAQALEYVVASKKGDSDVWMELVKSRIDCGQMVQAQLDVVDGCKAYPRNKELLALAASVRQLGTRTTDPMAQELELARAFMEKGDLASATQKLATLERLHRPTRAMKFVRAELDAAAPGVKQNGLVVTVNALMKQYTEAWEPRALLAELLMREGALRNPLQAVTHAEEAWQMSGGNPRVGATLVRAYLAAGRVAVAQALADQVRTLGAEAAARVDAVMAKKK